eukprot:1317850-Amorphochlora_amoeboformis.AAC.1
MNSELACSVRSSGSSLVAPGELPGRSDHCLHHVSSVGERAATGRTGEVQGRVIYHTLTVSIYHAYVSNLLIFTNNNNEISNYSPLDPYCRLGAGRVRDSTDTYHHAYLHAYLPTHAPTYAYIYHTYARTSIRIYLPTYTYQT